MAENGRPSEEPKTLNRIRSEWDPIGWSKVDSLGAVETFVEATVVSFGEGDHKLAGVLLQTENGNA